MSWQNRALTWLLRCAFKPRTSNGRIDIAAVRRHTRKGATVKLPRGWRLDECYGALDAPLLGEWIRPEEAGEQALRGAVPTVLYLHGGGYYFCSPRTHRPITCALAEGAHARVFALDYRLAPEHPFPAALDDALGAYRALLAAGVAPSAIVLAGDSAGGGLALATLVALRDAGLALPAGAVVFSPWTDLAATGESLVGNDKLDAMFHGAAIGPIAQIYLGAASATNPLASPLYADLHGLPPLLIQVSDSEVLRDDALRFAERAREAGVEVRLETWPDTPHAWQIFARWLPEARTALAHACVFIEGATQRAANSYIVNRRSA
jgi:monoterpene epsilon-lactone hydrolase